MVSISWVIENNQNEQFKISSRFYRFLTLCEIDMRVDRLSSAMTTYDDLSRD